MGAKIVRNALTAPLRQLASNAGEIGDVVVERVLTASGNNGYNGYTGEIEDLTKAGVVDPVTVARAALQNAGSVAMMMLSTDALIADAPEKKAAVAMPPPDGGMGGMGGF